MLPFPPERSHWPGRPELFQLDQQALPLVRPDTARTGIEGQPPRASTCRCLRRRCHSPPATRTTGGRNGSIGADRPAAGGRPGQLPGVGPQVVALQKLLLSEFQQRSGCGAAGRLGQQRHGGVGTITAQRSRRQTNKDSSASVPTTRARCLSWPGVVFLSSTPDTARSKAFWSSRWARCCSANPAGHAGPVPTARGGS